MNKKKSIAAILSLSLALGTFTVVAPEVQAAQKASDKQSQTKTTTKTPVVKTLDKLSSIKLTGKSSVKLTDVNMYRQDESNILSYTLTYTNNEARSIPLIDYWTKVRTKSGTVYSSNLTDADKDKKVIPAQSQLSVTYYAKVAKHLTVHDLNYDIIKWDFSKSNFENRIGSFQIPTGITTSTVIGGTRTVRMNDVPIKTNVDRVNIFPSDEYHYVNVAVNVLNAGVKVLENPAYKYAVKTTNGSSYVLVPDGSSKEYKLQPEEKKTLNFMTTIPKSVNVDKLELQVLQEQAPAKENEAGKINLAVGTFSLPKASDGNSGVPANKDKVITMNDAKVSTKITTGWVNQSYFQNDITLTFMFENLSNKPVTVPKYEFELHGPKGFSTPIPTKSLESLTLKPMEKRPITLNASVSTDVGTNQLKLHMNRPGDTGEKDAKETASNTFKYPEGIYNIPELQSMQNKTGSEYNVQHSKGNLGITIDSLQQLPWTDGNIVSAKMTIRNKESKTIQLPALEGVFKIDAAESSGKTQIVSSNGTLIIGPKEEINVYVVTKLPSYLDFTQLQIALLEKIGETDSAQLIQFTNIGSLPDLPVIEYGSYFNLETEGRKAEIMARKSRIYAGNSDQIVYTDLEMKSREGRQATLSQMVGYYRTSDGRYYKATMAQIDRPTSPEGRNVVTAWAKLPSSVDTKDMQLVLGEGIKENKLTAPKEESDGYVNAVAMNLEIGQPSLKRYFDNLDFFPYSLTITDFYATINNSAMQIDFNYELKKDMQYDMGEYGHKVVVEITDASNRRFEKEIDIDKDSGLKVGKNLSYTASFSDALFERIQNGGYQVSIYDSFQGEKVKLASYGSAYNIRNARTSD
ncbi:hypothetical protein [Paenibacillus apiarius]|uniref:hypothetical protein n=1 Tax=Paenibacillus apiarius TaxID=46240 RepID=UPI003B3A376D